MECVDANSDEGDAEYRGVRWTARVFGECGYSLLCGVLCELRVFGSEVWGEPEGISAVCQVFGSRLVDVLM